MARRSKTRYLKTARQALAENGIRIPLRKMVLAECGAIDHYIKVIDTRDGGIWQMYGDDSYRTTYHPSRWYVSEFLVP